jgi:hypothetical protein
MEKARESARTKAMQIIQTAALSGDWRAAAELLKLTFPADYRNSSRIDVTAIAQVSGVVVTEEELTADDRAAKQNDGSATTADGNTRTVNMDNEKLVWEQLTSILLVASEQALIDTIEAIATNAGVSQIEGFPVREFFERRKREKGEQLVSDLADANPTLASEVKAAMDKLDREREDRETNEYG